MKRTPPTRSRRSTARLWHCESLESRRLLAASLVLGGAQTVVPGATIDVSAFINSPPSGDTAAGQSEMSLVINPTNPLNLVGFSHRLTTPIVMDLYRSTNGGTSWTTTQIDNTDDGLGAVGSRYDPAVAFDANGTLYIAYGYRGSAVAPVRPSLVVSAASTDGGANFINFRTIDTQADIVTPSTTDTDLPGVDRWTLATGRDPNSGNQAAYITYTQNVREGASNDQRIVILGTRDGGAIWTAPLTINDGSIAGLSTGGLGATPVVSFGGEVFVTWWDTGTSVVADRDRDGLWANAFNFGADLTVRNDPGFVNIQYPSVPPGGTPTGPPAQPERGARFSPSLTINQFTRDLYLTCHQRFGTGNDTDILFGRSSDFGDTWTWITADSGTGTEFNPWIAWDIDSGALGIAYYTTEGDQNTGNDDVRPRMALSTDNGNTWTRTFLSTQISNEAGGYNGDYLEYNGFAFRDGTAHHLWASRYMGGGTDLDAFTTRVSLDSATNNNVLRISGIGGAPDDSTIIRRAPTNNNFIEVLENGIRTFAGLLASIDSITIETGGGVHALSIENLPPIPVSVLGSSIVDTITISALSGVSGLTFFGGDGNDTITLGSSPFASEFILSPVTVFGDAGNDTLVLGSNNADSIDANITFDGGTHVGGTGDRIVINDTAPTYSVRYDIAPSVITRDGFNLPRTISYANTEGITINAGSGADTVAVSNGVAPFINAFGNNGNDNFIVGGGNLTGTFPQNFNGGNGIDQITFDDHLDPTNRIWDVRANEVIFGGLISLFTTSFESVGILAGTGNDEITFKGTQSQSLFQSFNVDAGGGNDAIIIGFQGAAARFFAPANILGGAGNDTYTWQNASDNWYFGLSGTSTYPVLLDGGSGYNVLNMDETLRTSASVEFSQDRIFTTEPAGFPYGADINYDNMLAISFTASNSANAVSVFGVSSDIDIGNQVTINTNGGNDAVSVYPRNAAGDLTINGNIGIVGAAGTDSITVQDGASALPIGYTVTGANVFGLGTRGLGMVTVESLRINAGSGNDIFAVNGLATARPATLDGGGGNDTYDVFGSAFGASAPVSLTLADSAGFDTFNLNDQDLTNVSNATYGANFPGIVRVGTQIPHSGIDITNINAGAGADTLQVFALPASAGQLRFFGGPGNDALTMPELNPFLFLSDIAGRVTFDGQGGTNNSVTVSNTTAIPKTAHLDQSSLGAYPGDNLFGVGGSLHFLNIATLALASGTGADTIYAQPLATTSVSISGGSPTAAPGDRLNLALAGAQNYVVNGTPASGSVTSTNLRTLTYTGFETGPTIDAIAPAVVAANINLNGIPGFAEAVGNRQALAVQFSENVASMLSPSSLQLTNLTTGQIVPTANIAVQYNAATNTAQFTFPGYPNGVLPDGNYAGKIFAGLPDFFGNALPADANFTFFFVNGDANHDRSVNLDDFTALAAAFGTAGTFSQGDFDYSGNVNLDDFTILASKFGTTLPAPAGLPSARSTFSATAINADDERWASDRILAEIVI